MTGKILEIENLTVSFDGFKALNQLNFSMDAGELRVIIGPNGAGKTTFLDIITGKFSPPREESYLKAKISAIFLNIKFLVWVSVENFKRPVFIST